MSRVTPSQRPPTLSALTDYDIATLGAALREAKLASSHAPRVLRAFYAGALDALRPELGKRLCHFLDSSFPRLHSTVVRRVQAGDGTVKLLLGFDRGGFTEAVLMPAQRPDRAAACVSSQIGCAMGCDFCASTRNGLERDLTAAEITEQYLHLHREAASAGRRITSLVFMGMGEPLLNLSQVIPAIRRIADPNMGGLGWRQITVSTVGIVPGLAALADADLNVHLALSLHAPDDVTRSRLLPVNRRYPVRQVIDAARSYFARTGRIVTIEYCLLAGVNDSPEQAEQLAALLAGFRVHVNLIPYNSIGQGVSGIAYQRPAPECVYAFYRCLRAVGVACHIRATRGDDVDAACGQLRRQHLATAEESSSPTIPLPVST